MIPKIGEKISDPMSLCLELASIGCYSVSPNPKVGAVLLNSDNILLGYGYHLFKGDQHAEVKAIDMAAPDSIINAKLYINIEPCCHYGAMPPCVYKILKYDIQEVHISMLDPNPLVLGKSMQIMRNAGIKVICGEKETESKLLNEEFVFFHTQKLPFVIAKWAMTINAKIYSKDSKYISDDYSRQHMHKIRNSVDAILIGANTALIDNPKLNVRNLELPFVRKMKRFLIDPNGKVPINYNIFDPEFGETFVIHSGCYPKDKIQQLKNVVQFINVKSKYDNTLDLNVLLSILKDMDITSLMIEGGSRVIEEFIKYNLINKFYCYISPNILSTDTKSFIGDNFNFKNLCFRTVHKLENDILIIGNAR